MINQKSYLDSQNALYLVPTPIGNFSDMTYRAVEILKSVDYIYCEDTRVTYNLLSHFNITTPVKSYHIFNEDIAYVDIINKLTSGSNVALVSDAGMPVISDPGYLIVRKAIDAGFKVISIPGANAALTALVASGIPTSTFTFVGFLDHKTSQREKELAYFADLKTTLIIYEAPHRIKQTLESISKILGNREIVIARELTKKYEEYIRGNVDDIIASDLELKGEIVVIIKASDKLLIQTSLNSLSIKEHLSHYTNQGINDKDAMKMVARDRDISKSEVYKMLLKG